MKLHETITKLEPFVGQNLDIFRIEHALTNSTYLVKNGIHEYCLRLNNPDSKQLGIDRGREITILNHIQQEDWTPTILAFDTNWMLSEWKPGIAFKPQDNNDLTRLEHLFSSVQNMPIEPLSSTNPIDIARQIDFLRLSIPELEPSFTQLADVVCSQYRLPTELTLCFHDWHPGNLLKHENHIVLIDWEYAALGDPKIDLACLIAGFDLNAEQTMLLVESIGMSLQELDNSMCLTSLLSLCWYMVRFPSDDWRIKQLEWVKRWNHLQET